MKVKLIILTLLLVTENAVFCQRETDIGFAGGASYYMGDINPSIPFYSPGINLGIVYRYNFNMHYVLKIEANYLNLSGNDKDFTDEFRLSRSSSFNNTLADFSAQFEFNFLPLKFEEKRIGFSPFISAGAAYAYSLNTKNITSIPFALGMKFSFHKNWCFGLSWNFRKTFRDDIDKTINMFPEAYRTSLNNNDWYSFANIFVTYKIFDFRDECPAYIKSY